MKRRLIDRARRRFLYPWSDGTARRKDPTYGKVDRDIQWAVWSAYPDVSIATRLSIELSVQRRRDSNRPEWCSTVDRGRDV